MTNTTTHEPLSIDEAGVAEFNACHRELRAALGLSAPITWDQLIEAAGKAREEAARGPRFAREDLAKALGYNHAEPETWSQLIAKARDLVHAPHDADRHRCPAVFTVWCPEYGHTESDGGRMVRAADARRAAEQWASQHDSENDSSISGGELVSVRVRALDETLTGWIVSGQMVPEYSASSEMIGADEEERRT